MQSIAQFFIPAPAGSQRSLAELDARLGWNDFSQTETTVLEAFNRSLTLDDS